MVDGRRRTWHDTWHRHVPSPNGNRRQRRNPTHRRLYSNVARPAADTQSTTVTSVNSHPVSHVDTSSINRRPCVDTGHSHFSPVNYLPTNVDGRSCFQYVGRCIYVLCLCLFVNNFLAPIQVPIVTKVRQSYPWPQGTRRLNFGRSRSKFQPAE